MSEPSPDPLTYSGSVTTLKGAVAITPDGSFTYTPSADERNVAAVIGTADTDQFTVTAKTATTLVFNRIDYTVGGDGSVIGQVYFVDPQGQSMNIYGVGDDITPHFDQTGTGAFTIPASVIANYPSPFSMYVKATDAGNNATTVKVTFDLSTVSAPPSTTTQSQILTAYTSIFSSLGSGIASIQTSIDQADAAKLQAQAAQNQALIQQIDQQIDTYQANLANALTNFTAAQNNLGTGYKTGAFSNLPS